MTKPSRPIGKTENKRLKEQFTQGDNMDFHGPKSKEAQGNSNKAANSGAGPTELHCKPFSGPKGASGNTKGKTRSTGETELKSVNPGPRSNRVSFPEKMSSDRSSTTPNRRTRY